MHPYAGVGENAAHRRVDAQVGARDLMAGLAGKERRVAHRRPADAHEIPVSYTHLDVYKRQVPKRTNPELYKELDRTRRPLVYRWSRDGDTVTAASKLERGT